jgi:hypothetical protein
MIKWLSEFFTKYEYIKIFNYNVKIKKNEAQDIEEKLNNLFVVASLLGYKIERNVRGGFSNNNTGTIHILMRNEKEKISFSLHTHKEKLTHTNVLYDPYGKNYVHVQNADINEVIPYILSIFDGTPNLSKGLKVNL